MQIVRVQYQIGRHFVSRLSPSSGLLKPVCASLVERELALSARSLPETTSPLVPAVSRDKVRKDLA